MKREAAEKLRKFVETESEDFEHALPYYDAIDQLAEEPSLCISIELYGLVRELMGFAAAYGGNDLNSQVYEQLDHHQVETP